MEHSQRKKERPSEIEQAKKILSPEFQQALGEMTDRLVNKGMPPKDAIGVSHQYLENIYAQAYRLYNTGKYSEAAHLFRILVMFNAMEPKFTMGLAACFHMMKEYVNAIQTYTMCSALDPGNPIPHYHSSDCYLQMKEYLSAMLCLELAIDYCGDKPEFAKMKERANLSLLSLQEKAISSPLEHPSPSTKILDERKSLF